MVSEALVVRALLSKQVSHGRNSEDTFQKTCRKLKKDSLEIFSNFRSAAPTWGGNASSQTPKFCFAPDFGKCTALENWIEKGLLIGHVMTPLNWGMVDSWAHEISQADRLKRCIVHCHLSNRIFLRSAQL